MRKKLLSYILVIAVTFIGLSYKVNATITIDQSNSKNKQIIYGTTYDSTFANTSAFYGHSGGYSNYPYTHYRISTDDKIVYCADAHLGSPGLDNNRYNWTKCNTYSSNTKALKYIFNNGPLLGSDANEGYFITQMAIWYYTSPNDGWVAPFKNGTWSNYGATVKKIGNLIKNANTAVNANASVTGTVSSKTMTITNDKKYYISSPIKLTGTNTTGNLTARVNTGFITTNQSATSGTTTFANGATVYVKVPVSSVSNNTNVKLSISGTSAIDGGTFTKCDHTNTALQGLLQYDPGTEAVASELTLNANTGTVNVSKTSATGTAELPGAKLEIKDSAGNIVASWTSSSAQHSETLVPGTYKLIETQAPNGYVLSKEEITFEVKPDGTVTPSNITMKNKLTKVTISKQNITGTAEVPGATLEIQDKNGKIVKYCTDQKGNKNTECKWVSTDKPYEIEGMPRGTYYLVETIAPSRYALNTEKIKFEVKSDGTVSSAPVIMKNAYNKVIISKQTMTGGEEVPGATLEIQDENGNIVKYCKDEEGNEDTECKWISTDKPHEIEGLPTGVYYLVETLAPDRYVLNKEKVKFEVKENSDVTSVAMKNALNKVVISKLSATNKKELPGATLEIQDIYGRIVKYCTDQNGNKNTECKWVSTDKQYEIEGMPNGTYYLVETMAPKGYILNTEKVMFIVDGSKPTVKVEMLNKLQVKVPNTASNTPNIIIIVAVACIAIDAGVIYYFKKKKAI